MLELEVTSKSFSRDGERGTQVPRMRVCLVGTLERQQGLQVCGAERESSEMIPQRSLQGGFMPYLGILLNSTKSS